MNTPSFRSDADAAVPPTALVVLAHPNPASFNHALADAAIAGLGQAGFDVRMHDLYSEGFDPLASASEVDTSHSPEEILATSGDPLVRRHRHELKTASLLAVVHPNWWGKPPAMMSGWIDRVLIPGVAYTLDGPAGLPTPLLRLNSLYVVNTSDTTAEREESLFGDPLELIWKRCVGTYLGEPNFERLVLRTISDSKAEVRRQWLNTVAITAQRIGLSSR